VLNPYATLLRVPKARKEVPMPPGHGYLLERLVFERHYIKARMREAPPKEEGLRKNEAYYKFIAQVSLEAMEESLKFYA